LTLKRGKRHVKSAQEVSKDVKMSSNGGAVAKLLGFIPTDFYNEIASSIDTQIDNQIENFTKELLTVLFSIMIFRFRC
jgi:hypothetical protein